MIAISHQQPVQLTQWVSRLTASNAGPMTGPGTNSYLVGSQSLAIIDPGPADQAHIDNLLAAVGDRLKWILVTHTHPDHSPAAQALAAATGAKVMGNKLLDNDGFQDDSFCPTHQFVHDECLATEEFTIRALLTPGHVDNHICYLVEEDAVLFTGDHMMQGSTVVIIPPHGDMKDYIDSLSLLLDYPIAAIAPGHGYLMENPEQEIRGLIEHRLGREDKVVACLQRCGKIHLDELVPLVYDDVDSSLHPIAAYSLLAHLIKLEKEQRAQQQQQDYWSLTG